MHVLLQVRLHFVGKPLEDALAPSQKRVEQVHGGLLVRRQEPAQLDELVGNLGDHQGAHVAEDEDEQCDDDARGHGARQARPLLQQGDGGFDQIRQKQADEQRARGQQNGPPKNDGGGSSDDPQNRAGVDSQPQAVSASR